MIVFTIILAILLIICSIMPNEGSLGMEPPLKVFLIFSLLMMFACSVFDLSYNEGIKDGAYNQIRGKYEVTYVINKDSCVVDTIINLN